MRLMGFESDLMAVGCKVGAWQSDERASLEAVVEKVVGAAYEVSNVLGAGFLERCTSGR